MSNSNQELEPLWISQHDRMPDCCCVCGLYCDRTTALKAVGYVTKDPFDNPGWGLWVQLAMSLISPLFSLVLNRGADVGQPVTRRKKIKVQISQCMTCRQKTPNVIDVKSSAPTGLFVRVHPDFKRQFEAQNPASSSTEP